MNTHKIVHLRMSLRFCENVDYSAAKEKFECGIAECAKQYGSAILLSRHKITHLRMCLF